ncbi:hypothetical protein BGZ63DRAFT_386068 [Mariannaea sp. PMI_226]|nr:hypothetical protein BGZ63DRAFT_386068 [Mariannaea sp. PMI_226]
MITARPLIRSTLPRAARSVRAPRQHIRLQSTASPTARAANSSNNNYAAGIVGGFLGAGLFYTVYSFTPAGRTASKLNKTVKEAEKAYLTATKKLQEKTPTADEAVNSIKQFAYSYVGWVPGGRAYVDTAFDDWEKVRKNHREEADKLVNEAYKRFQDVSKSGFSLETASRAFDVLADLTKKVADLAGDAISDILDNHPQVKEKLGGNVDQLRQLGEQYGPDAKKQVEDTWKQVKDVFAGGFSASSIDKARKLIDEKVKEVKKLGDAAWDKALEEAKPILDKNPKVKELVEKNADSLKGGNIKEIFEKAKSAVKSGKLDDLESYVKSIADQAKEKGSDLAGDWLDVDKYLKSIPEGGNILERLQQLGEVAEKHQEEGEKLFKETVQELGEVLERKAGRAQEIAENAKKQVS